MATLDTIRQYNFPWPNDTNGYNLFPEDIENDPLVAFHGTAESHLNSIIRDGFKIEGNLPSVAFAKNSALSLGYAANKRQTGSPNGVVIAVRFDSLSPPCVVEEIACIYLYCQNKQPKIIGYCIIPESYMHV